MNGSRARRFAAAISATLLALMVLGPASTAAATPGWQIINTKSLPATVSPGKDAGYSFTIKNNGKSNIAQLFLTSSVEATPTYFTNSRGTVCQQTPHLFCAFGALNSGATIDVVVAYTTPTTGNSFSATFMLNATGNTSNDGGTSHGDTLAKTLSTSLNPSDNFGGGFVITAGTTVQNNQAVGRQNKQATTVENTEGVVPVTVEDGSTSGACTIAACSGAIAEWSVLNVKDNTTFGSAFKVTLLIWGGSVQGNPALTSFYVLHTRNDGTTYAITTQCTPTTGTPTNPECLTTTKVGQNYKIVVWLFQNGAVRGGV